MPWPMGTSRLASTVVPAAINCLMWGVVNFWPIM